jgi:hypothetical protein
MDEKDNLVNICYESDSPSEELDAKLDYLAGISEGVFVSSKVENLDITRTYSFGDKELSESFIDAANIAISAMQEVVIVTKEEIDENLRWKNSEAIYHHIGFENPTDAIRFYRLMRANFASYMSEDMYDMFVAQLDDDDLYVFLGLPLESAFVIDEGMEDEDDFFGQTSQKTKKKVQLN